jgi:hypothetical protein
MTLSLNCYRFVTFAIIQLLAVACASTNIGKSSSQGSQATLSSSELARQQSCTLQINEKKKQTQILHTSNFTRLTTVNEDQKTSEIWMVGGRNIFAGTDGDNLESLGDIGEYGHQGNSLLQMLFVYSREESFNLIFKSDQMVADSSEATKVRIMIMPQFQQQTWRITTGFRFKGMTRDEVESQGSLWNFVPSREVMMYEPEIKDNIVAQEHYGMFLKELKWASDQGAASIICSEPIPTTVSEKIRETYHTLQDLRTPPKDYGSDVLVGYINRIWVSEDFSELHLATAADLISLLQCHKYLYDYQVMLQDSAPTCLQPIVGNLGLIDDQLEKLKAHSAVQKDNNKAGIESFLQQASSMKLDMSPEEILSESFDRMCVAPLRTWIENRQVVPKSNCSMPQYSQAADTAKLTRNRK